MATEVVLPVLGITVEKGRIVEWVKREGDVVGKGEIIFIVETDKVTTEVESPASGILAKIIVPAGIEVPVMEVVGVITAPGEPLPACYAEMQAKLPAATGGNLEEVGSIVGSTTPPPSPEGNGSRTAFPAARRLAREKGVDLGKVTGSGPNGTITVGDIEALLAARKMPKASALARRVSEAEHVSLEGIQGSGAREKIMRADVERAVAAKPHAPMANVIPMSRMRQVIGRKMCDSAFTAPHVYFFADVLMDPLQRLRDGMVQQFESRFGVRPSVNDFLIKAVALNLVEFPLLNSVLSGDEIHVLGDVNVGLAVAVPDGLIVPAILHADELGIAEIVRQRSDLVARARSGKLTMDEIERGTFTISSLAQFEIRYFTAILNPPQSGILSVGKTREEVYLEKGEPKTRSVATLGLSVDHRIIDGALAAQFLQELKHKLESPAFTFLKV